MSRSQESNANRNHEMFAGRFLEMNAIPFPNRFQSNPARKSQDRYVLMYRRKIAILYHNKNVKTRKLKTAKRNARIVIGAKNVHLIKVQNLCTEYFLLYLVFVIFHNKIKKVLHRFDKSYVILI